MITKWFHIHDYDMQFPPPRGNPSDWLNYTMTCTRCGDRCAGMGEALRRTRNSRIRCWTMLIGGWTIVAVNVFWLLFNR